jgi:alpha-1,3-mannosyl-glycoprotein beta-1,2-N-acetylglucosaminyltransferase
VTDVIVEFQKQLQQLRLRREDKKAAAMLNLIHYQRLDRPLPPEALLQGHSSFGYYHIAKHYGWALKRLFETEPNNTTVYTHAIILEEDLDLAVDFFEYMARGKRLLDEDDSLLCISAWNDNGRPGLVRDAHILHRTDFFPGLGWLMSRRLWNEISARWPEGYWDDWLREPPQRRDRQCVIPEIPRTNTFGYNDGTSQGQFVDTYIRPMLLNRDKVDWADLDLDYLNPKRYKTEFLREIREATVVAKEEISNLNNATVFVEYPPHDYGRAHACDFFGLMNDEKAGVTRTSYLGVISFYRGRNKVHLAAQGVRAQLLKLNNP